MTVDQIRSALDFVEANYAAAMDSEAFGLATALHDKIMKLREMLVEAIIAADPYTTEADVRQFEGFY